jgi:hypothetical protein
MSELLNNPTWPAMLAALDKTTPVISGFDEKLKPSKTVLASENNPFAWLT